jgi:hypothetical protein
MKGCAHSGTETRLEKKSSRKKNIVDENKCKNA